MKSFSENHLSDEAYLCAELIIEEKIKNFSFAKQRAFKAIKKKLRSKRRKNKGRTKTEK